MNRSELAPRKPLARSGPGHLWGVVLAGGEGLRLRPLIRRLYGDERPKQYAALLGSRSLLGQTLDRVAVTIPPERTVVVTLRSHAPYLEAELGPSPAPCVLVQPEDRGTAAGVLFSVHWIQAQDSEAMVAVFPSDHFILEGTTFMSHIADVAAVARRHPERVVLFGARPSEPETEYGWIEPGGALGWSETSPLFHVRRFWEKPSAETARACLAEGWLWNTFVFVAKTTTLIDIGRQFLPRLHDRLAEIAPFGHRDEEAERVRQAYAEVPAANFSRAIFEPCASTLAVSPLPSLTWSDWGTPERVFQSLRRAGVSPPWLSGLDRPA